MAQMTKDPRSYRGMLQSQDGQIIEVIEDGPHAIQFKTAFGLSDYMIRRLKAHPEHIVFSERSRIARLGIQIASELPVIEQLEGHRLVLTQTATSVIPGYPDLEQVRPFFDRGFQVGRLVYCDPDMLLSSEELMTAIEKAELKLPASTAISSDGSILIAPHRVKCALRSDTDQQTLGRILLNEDGRDILNRYQISTAVPNLIVPSGEGAITTCSMYLNDHYVVLQSGLTLGRNLPATVLDPIKTRGIRIYLEIINDTRHTIVNPLIRARIYSVAKKRQQERRRTATPPVNGEFTMAQLKAMQSRFNRKREQTCHFKDKPVLVVPPKGKQSGEPELFTNGPESVCQVSRAQCNSARGDFSPRSLCPHVYATDHIVNRISGDPAVLVLKYFPNLVEHRDIINLVADGKVKALYFFEASCEFGPFLSQEDHGRLQEYHAYGVAVYWLCPLNQRLMVHTMRDGKGYFVAVEKLAAFHKSMLFAFYGSTLPLSADGAHRLGRLMDALVGFWGHHIGIVTGGGSGVMEAANTLARQRGILSGANFLDITDQSMTTDVDFCQVFQATCRHSRQKWFEIASFPIFNVGGLGSLEELGITLCNMKLSIMERVPIVLFDAEGGREFWSGIRSQILTMVARGRAPKWIEDYLVITDDPDLIIDVYRRRLQLF